MSKLSDEQVAALVKQISGGSGGSSPVVVRADPTTDMFERAWHISAVVILIGGVAGGVIMAKRGWKTSAENFSWTRPSSWSLAGLLGKL